jgi:hypothetical protein
MLRWIFGGALCVALLLLPARSDAKHHDGGAVYECQELVASRISADHPPSRGTAFDGNVWHSRYGNNAERISGQARVRTARGWNRRVTYSCLYNRRNGRVSAIRYDIH